ncbi:MAG: hypothetical protein HY675_29185 [Chloroflexi bacterium]|nr:hypothetical protein [Chloroflexota bacterium]
MRRHHRLVVRGIAPLICPVILVLVVLIWASAVGQAEGPTRLGPAQSAPPARYGHAMVESNGFVYLFGGVGEGGTLLNDLWRFGTVSATSNGPRGQAQPLDAWEEINPANEPPARFGHTIVEVSGTGGIVLFGGQGAGDVFDDVWSYNPAVNNWTPLPSQGTWKPEPRHGHQAVGIGDRMYVFGGRTGTGVASDWIWSYDLANGTWSQGTYSPSGSRYDFSAANVDGQMVVWGGRNYWGNYLSDLWRYDPTANQWSQLPITTPQQVGSSYPIPRMQPAAALPVGTANQATASQGNRMWVFGGQTQASPAVDNVWEFVFTNTTTVTVSALDPLAAPRTQAAAVALPQSGGQLAFTRLLVFGGRRNGQTLGEPVSYTAWSSPPRRLFLPVITRN